MKEKNSQRGHVSRRRFIKSTAGAGAVFAQALAVPRVLAAPDAAIRIGNINSYTGGLAYAGENNLNGMSLYFDSIGWTIAGRKIELIKEDDQFNPQVGLQKAKKLIESGKIPRNEEIVEKLQAFTQTRGHTMLELAFSWLASRPQVSSVIAGATRVEQVEQNAKAIDWQLGADDLAEIDKITLG